MFFDTNYFDTPNIKSLAAFRISQSEIPAELGALCKTLHADIKDANFIGSRVYLIEDPHSVKRLVLWYRHENGRTLLRLQIILDNNAELQDSLLVLSAQSDGSFCITSNSAAPQFNSSNISTLQFAGARPAELLHRHESKFEVRQAVKIEDDHTAEKIAEAYQAEMAMLLTEEGVFSERANASSYADTMAESDASGEVGIMPSPAYAPNERLEGLYATVKDEIEKIQTKTSSTSSNFILLIVSVIAFMALGLLAFDIRFLYFVIPILLFHELGHFIAMRVFKYKNVKMFFIPLLGAAVSGRNFNVEGWKKVIVSLAGPVPGILLAIPLAIVAAVYDMPLLRQSAIYLVVINGFNLLPLIPLDGGWVMHALFFSRHPWLDATFRVAAAVLMILAGIFLPAIFLAIFGGFMLIAIPVVLRNGRIAHKLTHENVPVASGDEQSVPPETMKRIVDELPKEGAQGTPKFLAQSTLQIFEILNTKSPRGTVTFGLLFLYIGSILACLAVPLAFNMAALGQFWEVEVAALDTPTPIYEVFAAEIERANELALDSESAHNLIVYEYEDEIFSIDNYEELKVTELPMARIGTLVLVSIQSDDEEFYKQPLEFLNDNAVKTYRYDSTQAMIQVSGIAKSPEQATAIKNQVDLAIEYPNGLLIEPWSPNHAPTAKQLVARDTLYRLKEIVQDVEESGELIAAIIARDGKLDELKSQKNPLETQDTKEGEAYYREASKAYQELNDVREKLLTQSFAKLKAEPNVDPEFIDSYLDYKIHQNEMSNHQDPWTEEQFLANVTNHLGQIPVLAPASKPTRYQQRFGLESAIFATEKNKLDGQAMIFEQPIDGLVAFLRWLDKQGVTDLKIQFGDPNLVDNLGLGDEKGSG